MTRRRPWILAALLMIGLSGCGGGTSQDTDDLTDEDTPQPTDQPSAEPAGGSGPQGSATISGTVSYQGEVPKLPAIKMDADPGCASKHKEAIYPEVLVLGDGNTVGNVFVRVKSGLPAGNWAPPTEPAVIDQQGCHYIPHVLGVMVNQPIKILNSDGLLHNIHAQPTINQPFNTAMPATRTETETRFTKEEFMVSVRCDVHPWMQGYVGVSSHPFFDVTEKDGRYEIKNLPAGTYELEFWHERLGTKTATVQVGDGQSATSDMTLSRS